MKQKRFSWWNCEQQFFYDLSSNSLVKNGPFGQFFLSRDLPRNSQANVLLYVKLPWGCMAFTLVVSRWKSKLCLGNSSVVKIYIIRPKPGPVAKNATPNPRPLDYQTSALPLSYRSRCRQLGREFSIYIYIYINEMVMSVKCKGILMYILTTLEFPTHNFDSMNYHCITLHV